MSSQVDTWKIKLKARAAMLMIIFLLTMIKTEQQSTTLGLSTSKEKQSISCHLAKTRIHKKIPESLKYALHKNYKELIGIFLWHDPVILFDNLSRNEAEQIVNDTKGLMESRLWIDKSVQTRMEKLISDAIECDDTEMLLNNPLDYIMTLLTDSKTHIQAQPP